MGYIVYLRMKPSLPRMEPQETPESGALEAGHPVAD
jgi:hypothetical protein